MCGIKEACIEREQLAVGSDIEGHTLVSEREIAPISPYVWTLGP